MLMIGDMTDNDMTDNDMTDNDMTDNDMLNLTICTEYQLAYACSRYLVIIKQWENEWYDFSLQSKFVIINIITTIYADGSHNYKNYYKNIIYLK